MRVSVLSCGSAIVESGSQRWLLGAPAGVAASLKAAGIDTPDTVLLTAMRSPGISELSDVIETRFKEQPVSIDGLSATPVQYKHGTDYIIKDPDAVILFSERGDVATKDTAGFDMVVVKNKHRSDDLGGHVMTWPWADVDVQITNHDVKVLGTSAVSLKVWASEGDVPDNLKSIEDANLTLAQANFIARVAEASGEGDWAIAISQFKKSHTRQGDRWVHKDKESAETLPMPQQFKELAPDIPDVVDQNGWATMYKGADGTDRWATITAVSMWDKQGELLTHKAIDWALNFAKVVGAGPLRFRHVPGWDGGDCDRQVRVDDYLFESGTFRDDPMGLAMKEVMRNGSGWRISPGLLYGPKDLVNGVYSRTIIFERSLTQNPVIPATATLTIDGGNDMVKVLTKEQLDEVSKELGLDVSFITELHQKALAGADAVVGVKEFKEFALKQAEDDKNGERAKGTGDDTDREDEMNQATKESNLAELATQLKPEQRTELLAALGVSEQPESFGLEDVLKELQTINTSLDETRAIAEKALQESAGGISTDLLLEAAGQPRRKPQFLTRSKSADVDADGEAQEVDTQIFEKLDNIEKKLKEGTGGGDLYDSFTSRKLGKPEA